MLLYDGDCGFCSRCAGLARRLGPRLDVVPYQRADLAPLGLTADQCAEAVRYVDGAGVAYRGHLAIDAFLRDAGAWWLRWPLQVPGTGRVWAWLYNLVARHRTRLPGGTPDCKVPPP